MYKSISSEQWLDVLTVMGVYPGVADDWADVFEAVIRKDTFSSPRDLPNFLAQALHESGRLTRLDENLNYSAERLRQVWPARFQTLAIAQPYARNPRALANKVYGGRLGNDLVDDGWRYHGRGLIQLTGRDNYALAQELTGLPLIDMPELLLEPEPALRASVSWWEETVPDTVMRDIGRVTRYVNGGYNGLQERRRLTQVADVALAGVSAA
jgi:putative chitinase